MRRFAACPRRDGLHRCRHEDLARPLQRVERVGLRRLPPARGGHEAADLSHHALGGEGKQRTAPGRGQILGVESLANETTGVGELPPLKQAAPRQRVPFPQRLAHLVQQLGDLLGGRGGHDAPFEPEHSHAEQRHPLR